MEDSTSRNGCQLQSRTPQKDALHESRAFKMCLQMLFDHDSSSLSRIDIPAQRRLWSQLPLLQRINWIQYQMLGGSWSADESSCFMRSNWKDVCWATQARDFTYLVCCQRRRNKTPTPWIAGRNSKWVRISTFVFFEIVFLCIVAYSFFTITRLTSNVLEIWVTNFEDSRILTHHVCDYFKNWTL